MSFSAVAQSLGLPLPIEEKIYLRRGADAPCDAEFKLLSRSPLAADGRHDGTLLLQLGESLVDLLAVGTQCLRHVASRDGLASLTHGL